MAKAQKTKPKHSPKQNKHASKPAQMSKARPRRNSIVSPTKTPRGPLLVTYFPTVSDNEEDPAEVPDNEKEFKKQYWRYSKMKVLDSQTNENVFGDDLIRVNDFIQIRSGEVGGQSVSETEKWYAQVIEIGSRKEPGWARDDVCLQVAWFYDRNMLKQRTLTSEDRKLCANMLPKELIPSDHFDIVHLSSVLGRVNVVFYNEQSLSQCMIDGDDLFYRRRLQDNQILMFRDTCLVGCKVPYSPGRDIQHYCPRDQCERWYHVSCMMPNKHHQDDYRLAERSSHSLEQQLLDLILPESSSKKFKTKTVPTYPLSHTSSETEAEVDVGVEAEPPRPSTHITLSLAGQLPLQIRALAVSAITRGLKSGNGVVGNAWVVAAARYMAYEVIVRGQAIPQGDLDEISSAANEMNENKGAQLAPLAYMCPGCGHSI